MLSKPAMFVLRFVAVQEDEFGDDGFTSLDAAEALVAAGHDLDPRPAIQELVQEGYAILIERAEDTGGFNYYVLSSKGQAIGYPEKFGQLNIARIVAITGPLQFSLTTLGILGSPFAIASIFGNWINWNTFAYSLVETYQSFFEIR